MKAIKINISEIFYSLQGEGARSGKPTFFIRTQGCKVKNACYKSGVVCDTEFMSGKEFTLKELLKWIKKENEDCKEITWTGGEPAEQVTFEVVEFFKQNGYYQAIETSGLFPVPENLDFYNCVVSWLNIKC